MTGLLEDVRFAFQPLFNLHTGGVVAIEALARPASRSVYELLRDAARAGELLETDVALAAAAVRAAAEHNNVVPLHVNVLAATVSKAAESIGPLLDAMRDTGRAPDTLWLEVGTPYSRLRRENLRNGLDLLRSSGFHIALDGIGDGDVPLSLYTELAPEMIKLDRRIVAGLPTDAGKAALVHALTVLAEHNGAQLVAEGVENEEQLAAVRRLGFGLAQGNLLAMAGRRPNVEITIAAALTKLPEGELTGPVRRRASGPRVTDFLHPATMLPCRRPPRRCGPSWPTRARSAASCSSTRTTGRASPWTATDSCWPSPVRTGTRCTPGGRPPGWPTGRTCCPATPPRSTCWTCSPRPSGSG